MNSAHASLDIGYRHYAFLIYRLIYGEFPPISSQNYSYLYELDEKWFNTKITKAKNELTGNLKLNYLVLFKKKVSCLQKNEYNIRKLIMNYFQNNAQ